MTYTIYNSQKEYINSLVKDNLREDKRKFDEYRNISVEVNTLSQANGSARVKLGNTEVIVGVKLSVGTPFPDSEAEGILIVNAELSPLASDKFETGPPSPAAIELSRVIDRAIRESGTIDTSKLCIKAKEKVWIVFVDIYPINDDGNLFDAGLIGAIVALKNAKLPKYDIKEEKVDHRELTKNKLPIVDEPILCTFAKIGGELLIDPTSREEEVMSCRLSVAINKKGNVCDMQKGGEGTLNDTEIMEMIDRAKKLATTVRKEIA
jgi:exosome complex component RRP42